MRYITKSGQPLPGKHPKHETAPVCAASSWVGQVQLPLALVVSSTAERSVWRGRARILATSAKTAAASSSATTSTFRQYGSDYQELTLGNIVHSAGMVVAKSLLMASAQGMNEYNVIADKALARFQKGLDEEEVDWEDFYRRHVENFYKVFYKNATTHVIRQFYEVVARRIASPKIFDRLTKVPLKSAQRKLAKAYLTRLGIARKMLATSMWSCSVTYCSLFTYDVALALYEHYSSKVGGKVVEFRKALEWTGKKLALYTISAAGTAAGFSVGLFISPKYGVHLGPLIGEALGSAFATEVLGLS